MSGKARRQRHERRTLGTEGVEDWLARLVSRDISDASFGMLPDASRYP